MVLFNKPITIFNRLDKTRKIAIIVLIVVLALGFLMSQKSLVYAKLQDYKLVPIPESYTELYFNDHTKLPSEAVSNKPYSFGFTIHNLTGKEKKYTYQVIISVNGVNRLVDSSTVVLENGASKSISQGYIIDQATQKADIIVDLPYENNQYIDYKVNVK